MKKIICTTQAELDAVAVDFDGKVIIKFGTPSFPIPLSALYHSPASFTDIARIFPCGTTCTPSRSMCLRAGAWRSRVRTWKGSCLIHTAGLRDLTEVTIFERCTNELYQSTKRNF